mmetsp:Transcript_59655/g.134406  ORF Transcript_59655/g.134406 Transcript_59655/m.134406 type:complete len:344 (-) Transcript_59655:87-1118(-)
MQQILNQRRESKHAIHFRDDLSEYSSPSSWGEGPGPLSVADHRLAADGLQARRTVGEALLRAQWERQCEARSEKCKCLGSRTARWFLGSLQLGLSSLRLEALGRVPYRPSVVFTWAEVQSVILLPYEEVKGPFLIAVTTFRPREDGSREWLLQAGSLRRRARWGIEMIAALLRDRGRTKEAFGSGPCKCCGSGRSGRLSTALFMDMVRVACEAARLQPSAEGMGRLVEVLELLVEGRHQGQGGGMEVGSQVSGTPHFPLAALKRFGDSVQRARVDFIEWQQWREVALLVRQPDGWDADLWRGRVLPFLWPREPSLRDLSSAGYPAAVGSQLAGAAERCRRTMS